MANDRKLKNRAADDGSILQLNAISKVFEKSNVLSLKDITFSVKKNEFLCILGPNGCGKTTLLNMIAGFKPFFPPSQGDIRVDGQFIDGPGSDRVMVFQEESLFPWLTVRKNIEFGLKIKGVSKSERRAIADYYLKLMGVEDFKDKHPFELSGGMKQKTELARAFALKPKILLLDEPFAKVDAMTRYNLQEELLRVAELEKSTVLFVTHSVQEAVFLGESIYVMTKRPGTILEKINVNIPKPRKLSDTVGTAKFSSIVGHLLGLSGVRGFSENHSTSIE
jgi:NitT/TauT family transport system ATP-binding protein